MVEFKPNWEGIKRRVVGWARDMILIFGMWCIWLVNKYVPNVEIKNVITGFLITMIAITVLIREYFVTVDSKVIYLEQELNRIKKKDKLSPA